MSQTELEFVNDWSELETAIAVIKESLDREDGVDDWDGVPWRDVVTLIEYVPRLLTQYANLVELSFALTEGWEQYATLQKPTGLYLPDHG